MTRSRPILCLLSFLAAGFALAADSIANWPAPATWSAPRGGFAGGVRLLSETNPLPFIAVTPCRGADTRGNGFTGQYGPPSLGGSSARNFTIVGTCGIPTSAAAVSFNFTVTNNPSFGDIRVYPTGGSVLTSTLNWGSNTGNVANAAVVPLSAGGAITVQVDGPGPLDLIYDINGYYYDGTSVPLQPGEQFRIIANIGGGGSIYGLNNNGSGFGVWGEAVSGIGVLGSSTGNVGTKGTSTNYNGVWAESTNQDGLFASGGRDGAFIQGGRFGAFGNTRSATNDTAGVIGTDSTGASGALTTGFFSAGVRGLGKNGVIGITSTSIGNGVVGVAISPATIGVQVFGSFAATGGKAFIEPHPSDPSKVIRYLALEGPEAGTYFRGTAHTVNHEAVIEVPDSFRMVTADEGLTTQLTPVGELAQMAVMSQDLNQIVVRSSRDVTFHYHVNGIRRALRDWQIIADGLDFRPTSPDQRMPGWLTEEAKSRLIANGTYNPDETVNMNTAERLGWAKVWRDEAAAAAAAHK